MHLQAFTAELTTSQLFQKDGEGGLEVCPGRKVVGDFGMGQNWLPVQARQDRIVCNIGDQLMRVSTVTRFPRPTLRFVMEANDSVVR